MTLIEQNGHCCRSLPLYWIEWLADKLTDNKVTKTDRIVLALLGVLLLLLQAGTAFSDPVAVTAPRTPIMPQASYWHDRDGRADAAALVAGQFDDRFGPVPAGGLIAGPGNQWLRFELHNAMDRAHLLLLVESFMVAEIELVYRDAQGLHIYRAGRDVRYAERPVTSDFPTLPLTLAPGATQTFYLKMNLVIGWPMQPYITTELDVLERIQGSAGLSLMLAGLVIGVMLYMVVLALFTREWGSVGWYAGIMVCSALILLARHGYLARFTDGLPYLQLSGLIPLAALERAFTFLFIRSLFRTPQYYPLADRFLVTLTALTLLFVPLSLVFDAAQLLSWNMWQSLLTSIALIGASAYLTWRGAAQATLFLGGIIAYLCLQGLYNLVIQQVLPYTTATRYLPELGTLVLALTYTLLLSERLRRYRSENFRLETDAAVAQAENRAKSELLAS
jgi:hypothetical protein